MSDADRIKVQLIEEEVKDSYLNYAMSVIVSRALPDVRDGLKPSQRRILIAMNDLNLGPGAKHRKCAKIAGDTSGNYHPHGESVIYPTLVRMGQDWVMRNPLIHPQGNFGDIDGDPPAAMRYTEARMTRFTMLLLDDLELDTVDFRANYDDTRTEPVVLPGKFPNLLCNGSAGIAVGMATSIPPHNLGEVCDAIVKLLDNPAVTVAELMQCVKGPDFPTGGIICGGRGIRDAYETGRGHITVRGRVEVEEVKGGRKNLIVTQIPYNLQKARLIEQIAGLVKEDRITGISDIRDESDKEGMRIVVEVKRDEDEQIVLNQLYTLTPLQETFSIITIALVDNRPRVLSLKELCEAYRDHRIEVIRRRTRFLLEKAKAEAHILEGLVKALDFIDEVIALIRGSKEVPEARRKLMERFEFTELQADAILKMTLQRLTGLEREKLRKDLDELYDKINEYSAILSDESLIVDIIREDLFEMKELSDPRRTEISAEEAATFDKEDLIQVEAMAVVLTHEGYLKRVPLEQYRKQKRGGKGVIGAEVKETDFIEHLFVGWTHDTILFFTDRGRVHWQKVHELPKLPRTAKGKSVANLLNLNPGEKITAAIPVADFEKGFLVMATRTGIVKKTELSAFGNPKRGGIIALKLEEKDALVGVRVTDGNQQVVLATTGGFAIRFAESDLRPMGRTAYGVYGMKLREGDEIVDMIVTGEGKTLLSVCENGYGKRTDYEEYRLQTRGGMGVINIKATDRNGKVVGMKAVNDDDGLILMTEKGMAVRTAVKEIREMGRGTQGVRLITVDAGDKLVSIAKVESEESAEALAEKVPAVPPAPGGPPPVAMKPPAPMKDETAEVNGEEAEKKSAEENGGEPSPEA